MLKPFFDQYLKMDAPKADTPPVFIYNTGENHWDRLKTGRWPAKGLRAHQAALSRGGFRVGIREASGVAADSYVSDPAKPVPYISRPVRFADSTVEAMAGDRSAVGADRTDVSRTQPLY